MSKNAAPVPREQKQLNRLLLTLTILTLLNLLLTASIVGLIAGVIILVMVWGIRQGDYPLQRLWRFSYASTASSIW